MCRDDKVKSEYQIWGYQQEQLAAQDAQEQGLHVSVPDDWQEDFDMTLFDNEGKVIQIEVKAARPKPRPIGNGSLGIRLQFKNKAETQASVFWLRAWWDDEVTNFFVPSEVMAEKPGVVSITSDPKTYDGWLSEYREAWHIIYERMV